MLRAKYLPQLIMAIILLGAGAPRLYASVVRSTRARAVAVGLAADPGRWPQLFATLTGEQAASCPGYWLTGLVADRLDWEPEREQSWSELIICSEAYLPLLTAIAPEDARLANQAVARYPARSLSWFWLADAQTPTKPVEAAHLYIEGLKKDPENLMAWRKLGVLLSALPPRTPDQMVALMLISDWAGTDQPGKVEALFVEAQVYSTFDVETAVALYRQGLQSKPMDGIRWRELGDLLSTSDPHAAIEAYLQSCYNRDPGSNGCWRAGLTAEKLGELETAISYYRLSQFAGALERAKELERRLQATP